MNRPNSRLLAATLLLLAAASLCLAQSIPPPRASRLSQAIPSSPLAAQENNNPAASLRVDVRGKPVAGAPALVAIKAVDKDGNFVSGYKGPVTLHSSNTDDKISPAPVVNGVAAFVVVFNAPGNDTLTATDSNNQAITGSTTAAVMDTRSCWWIPIRSACAQSADDINNYFSTSSTLSYFNQIKSIYNGASGSANVSGDVATLNFPSGMQLTATTNVQAGPTASSPSSGTPAVGTWPTLAPTSAAQAAQNILNGGTVVASARYPLIGYGVGGQNNPGNLAISADFIAKEGIDIQNFKSGTSIVVTSPPSHTSAQLVGYLLYNAINPDTASGATSKFAGSFFIGGAYGYSYTSHGYALDYGIPHQGNHLGQISAGIRVNDVVNVVISRGFGPSQTYYDSTSPNATKTTINNFKAWSIGIAYQQSSTPKTSGGNE